MEQEPKTPEQGEFKSPELETRPEQQTSPERSAESEADRARGVEAARENLEQQSAAETEPAHTSEKAPKKTSGIGRKQAYQDTMASLQRHLPTISRGFSKVIHNPVVDKTSEVVGQTVLRPSVTVGATSTALIVGGLTYLVAKHYSYSMPNSLILFSLLVGAVVGLIIEFVAKLFRRKT